MRTSVYVIGFAPPVVTLAGLPWVNSTTPVLGLPLIAFWVVLGILLTSGCLFIAHRLLAADERAQGGPR
jgi:hypothetical protein